MERLRGSLMTTLVAMVGLLPAAISRGVGSQTERPLAIVVIGGVLLVAFLTRVFQPPLLVLVQRQDSRGGPYPATPTGAVATE